MLVLLLIASHRIAGLFTIVTFPFLFGIMYGDIGHGVALLLGALYLVVKEKELEEQVKNKTINEVCRSAISLKLRHNYMTAFIPDIVIHSLAQILSMAFGARYLLVSMGICAIYCGVIYNDCLSIPLNVYGSGWVFEGNNTVASGPSKVYPIGLDPLWFHTSNQLTFANSMKMKIAVTFGVVQMVFGILLSLFNHVYFKKRLSIWFEFLPQMVFMLCTFGYMIFLIVFKFTIDWSDPSNGNPPNLIQASVVSHRSDYVLAMVHQHVTD